MNSKVRIQNQCTYLVLIGPHLTVYDLIQPSTQCILKSEHVGHLLAQAVIR